MSETFIYENQKVKAYTNMYSYYCKICDVIIIIACNVHIQSCGLDVCKESTDNDNIQDRERALVIDSIIFSFI